MARPKKDGLLYFSFDTDFFYADKRIKRLHSMYGNDGIILFIYLMTEIYRNGYYIGWDEETEEDTAADLYLKEGFIKQVMAFLRTRSLITMVTLATEDTVITSPGIQKRYQEAVKSLRRDVYVDPDIWLLNDENTADYIKFTQKHNKLCKNHDKSRINESKSSKNDIKEIKTNEINKKTMCKADALALFERLWKLYPVKKGKGQISDRQKTALLEIGFDEMARAIERYQSELKKDNWRKPQNGSTFFNSGYVDYLDVDYVPDKKLVRQQGQFNQFPQREYDYSALEEELLSRGG